MDPHRFDGLARSLADTRSRRKALKLLASGAVGAVLAGLRPSGAAACATVGRRCDRNRDCCSGAYCGVKRCRCRPGFERCGLGSCVRAGDCCLASGSSCSPQSTPCCGSSECTGTRNGRRVCCGLPGVHDCTAGTAAFCCSGACDPDSGKCAPVPSKG